MTKQEYTQADKKKEAASMAIRKKYGIPFLEGIFFKSTLAVGSRSATKKDINRADAEMYLPALFKSRYKLYQIRYRLVKKIIKRGSDENKGSAVVMYPETQA